LKRRKFVFRLGSSAVAVLLVLAGVIWLTGWKKPPEYAGFAPIDLPVPIMTDAEYDQVIQTHRRPYVYEIWRGSGAVLVFGAEHTRDPQNPQIRLLRESWAQFRPTAALVEGRMGFLPAAFVDPVRQFGESGAVYRLARRHGVEVLTWEQPLEAELNSVLREYPPRKSRCFMCSGLISETGASARRLIRCASLKNTAVSALAGLDLRGRCRISGRSMRSGGGISPAGLIGATNPMRTACPVTWGPSPTGPGSPATRTSSRPSFISCEPAAASLSPLARLMPSRSRRLCGRHSKVVKIANDKVFWGEGNCLLFRTEARCDRLIYQGQAEARFLLRNMGKSWPRLDHR
jgi:hypothetical protein